jgi:hypothetical protein
VAKTHAKVQEWKKRTSEGFTGHIASLDRLKSYSYYETRAHAGKRRTELKKYAPVFEETAVVAS